MVAVTRQDIGRAALERRSGTGIGRVSASWVIEKVARGSGVEVSRNIAVLPLTLIGEAAIHARVVDLLRECLRVSDTAAHRPGPAIHRAVPRVVEVIEGHKIPSHSMEAGCNAFAEESQRRIAVRTIPQIAENLIERAVFLHDVDDMLDFRL